MTTVTGLHDDDTFHAPNGDPWWFESFWFSFFVPDRRLMVYVYPWFRASLGTCGGGVLAWDHLGAEPWNIVHSDYQWHLPCPEPRSLADGNRLVLPQGITIEVLKSVSDFRIQYQSTALSLDVTYRAVHPASVSSKPIADSKLFAGRIDQCGRVTGDLWLGDERIAVDCHSIRDRSWGIRRDDNRQMHIGYVHATISADDAFLAVSDPTRAAAGTGAAPVVMGYLVRDGLSAPLTKGVHTFTRDERGVPTGCRLEATDASGRELVAVARPLNRFAYQPFPGMFNWSSLAEWEFDRHRCVGEMQETWHPDRWRAFSRAHLAKLAGKDPGNG
jgi:hypothetical protein